MADSVSVQLYDGSRNCQVKVVDVSDGTGLTSYAILTASTSGLNPTMGNHVMLISIAATIVGGVGSLRGAALAGLLLGMAENVCLAIVDPQWSEAVTFVILFLFILFRPGGVYGRAVVS